MNNNIKNILFDWLGYIINGMLALVYILVQSLTAGFNQIDVWEILLGSMLYFLVSTAMRTSMLQTGMHKGYASEQWKSAAQEHENRIQQCLPYCDHLQEYLDEDYHRRLRTQRVAKLRGVAYDKVFNDDDTLKEYIHPMPDLMGLNKRQKREHRKVYRTECRSIRNARRVNVPLYYAGQLFTRSKSSKRKYNVSTKRVTTELTVGGLLISAGSAILTKLFAPGTFNVTAFFIALGMSLLAIAFSFIALYQGYTLITQSLRADVVEKVHDLDKFIEWAKQKQIGGNYGQQNQTDIG